MADAIAALPADHKAFGQFCDLEDMAIEADDPESDAANLANRMLPIRNVIPH